jgi:mannose-6-phosphate isomerase-like protein (cupin superfamily)
VADGKAHYTVVKHHLLVSGDGAVVIAGRPAGGLHERVGPGEVIAVCLGLDEVGDDEGSVVQSASRT